jgi:Lon protease-like protein
VLVHTADGAEGNFISRLEELEDAEIVSNLIAAALTIDAHAKQKLLETLDLQERLEMLIRIIEHQIAHKAILQKILAKAPRNIHDN